MEYKPLFLIQKEKNVEIKSIEYMVTLNEKNNYINDNNFNPNNNSSSIILYNESNFFKPTKKHKRKYDSDCLRKKIKHLILKYSLEFINSKIKKKKNKIKKIIDKQITNTKILFEREFLHKTLGDIFSTTVSKKYKKEKNPESYNINKIIDLKLINENLKNIFNLEFIQCLNHFIGKKMIEELNGMKTIYEINFKNENEEKNIIYYASNYEENVLRAMPRNYN